MVKNCSSKSLWSDQNVHETHFKTVESLTNHRILSSQTYKLKSRTAQIVVQKPRLQKPHRCGEYLNGGSQQCVDSVDFVTSVSHSFLKKWISALFKHDHGLCNLYFSSCRFFFIRYVCRLAHVFSIARYSLSFSSFKTQAHVSVPFVAIQTTKLSHHFRMQPKSIANRTMYTTEIVIVPYRTVEHLCK